MKFDIFVSFRVADIHLRSGSEPQNPEISKCLGAKILYLRAQTELKGLPQHKTSTINLPGVFPTVGKPFRAPQIRFPALLLFFADLTQNPGYRARPVEILCYYYNFHDLLMELRLRVEERRSSGARRMFVEYQSSSHEWPSYFSSIKIHRDKLIKFEQDLERKKIEKTFTDPYMEYKKRYVNNKNVINMFRKAE